MTRQPQCEPYDGKEPFIFVSYSSRDDAVLDDIEELGRSGFRIWYYKELPGAGEWRAGIETKLDQCQLFLIFVSPNAMKSKYVIDELDVALIDDIPILPIFLADLPSELFRTELRGKRMYYNEIRRRTGVFRYKFTGRLNEYYQTLCEKLEGRKPETRDDPVDRDSKALGIGLLSSAEGKERNDSLSPETPISVEEQEEAIRCKWASTMRDREQYTIPNVFQLTSEATRAMANLKARRMPLGEDGIPVNLLARPLRIEQAYVAPLRLVTGLITRLEANWPPLVASYSNLVARDRTNHLDDVHYYITFCWLAWGPSVPATLPEREDDKFVVLQAAFGDEANSVPLIMSRNKWAEVAEGFGKQRYSGGPVCLDGVLVVRPNEDAFFNEIRDYSLFKSVFFNDGDKQIALYVPDTREITALVAEGDAFYSTAYIWLMLEQTTSDRKPLGDKLTPGKVLPFFEHANLASRKGLHFLQHCLARKALHHVLECDKDSHYSPYGYYRFATAMFPKEMVDILNEEITELTDNQKDVIARRLTISHEPTEWRTAEEVVVFADDVNDVIIGSLKSNTSPVCNGFYR